MFQMTVEKFVKLIGATYMVYIKRCHERLTGMVKVLAPYSLNVSVHVNNVQTTNRFFMIVHTIVKGFQVYWMRCCLK